MNIFNNQKLIDYVRRHLKTLIPFMTPNKMINIINALYEMKTKIISCHSRPFIIKIDPCLLCNLRCPSCGTPRLTTKEKRVMDYDDFTTIIDEVKKYAIRASLYDNGEPLVHKDIYKMIKYCSEKRISTVISTNFNLFKEKNIEELFDSQLTVLEPCLDGFTQESYEKYRVGGNVETVKNGIRLVMNHKLKNDYKVPNVDVQVVLFDHIMHEINSIKDFLLNCKVDNITFRQESLGFNSNETTIKNRQGTGRVCFWLYTGMVIRPNGNVYPCSGKGFNRLSYGNILNQDLSEIWNNKYYKFSRSLSQKGPDLEYDEEMKNIPCLSCRRFSLLGTTN